MRKLHLIDALKMRRSKIDTRML